MIKLRLCKYALAYGELNSISMDHILLQQDPEDQFLKWRAGNGEDCLIHDEIYCYCVLVADGCGKIYQSNAKDGVLEKVLNVPRRISRLDVIGAAKGDRCPEHGRRNCYCAVMRDEGTGEMRGADIKGRVFEVMWHFTATHSYSEIEGWVPRAVLP